MNLQNWINDARQSWKENNPTYYRALVEAQGLTAALTEAAERTHLEMTALEEAGMNSQDAWEMTRERYLFLKPETD